MKDIPSRVLLREGRRFHRRTSLYKLPVWQAKTERRSHSEEVSPAFGLGGMWAGLAGQGASRAHPEARGHHRFSGDKEMEAEWKGVKTEFPQRTLFPQRAHSRAARPLPQKVCNRESELGPGNVQRSETWSACPQLVSAGL